MAKIIVFSILTEKTTFIPRKSLSLYKDNLTNSRELVDLKQNNMAKKKKKKERRKAPEEKKSLVEILLNYFRTKPNEAFSLKQLFQSSKTYNPSGKNALHRCSGRNVGRQLPD